MGREDRKGLPFQVRTGQNEGNIIAPSGNNAYSEHLLAIQYLNGGSEIISGSKVPLEPIDDSIGEDWFTEEKQKGYNIGAFKR